EHGLIGKQTFFEGSARIPLLMCGEGIPAGMRVQQPVSLLDLAPTLIDLAGAPSLPEPDGLSLRRLMQGNTNPDRSVITEYCGGARGCGVVAGCMIRRGPWKLIHYDRFE